MPILNAHRRGHSRLFCTMVNYLRRIPKHKQPPRWAMYLLSISWGNLGYAASVSYLLHIWRRAMENDGNILECGSGLSTIVLAIAAERKGTQLYFFENHPTWHQRLNQALESAKLETATSFHAEIISYGDFDWYNTDQDDLPDAFKLVICDGPHTKTTRGGRYGLLDAMSKQIPSGALVILDDAHRKTEKKIIEQWKALRDVEVEQHTLRGSFVDVHIQSNDPKAS